MANQKIIPDNLRSVANLLFQKGRKESLTLLYVKPHFTGRLWWRKQQGYVAAIDDSILSGYGADYAIGYGSTPEDAVARAVQHYYSFP